MPMTNVEPFRGYENYVGPNSCIVWQFLSQLLARSFLLKPKINDFSVEHRKSGLMFLPITGKFCTCWNLQNIVEIPSESNLGYLNRSYVMPAIGNTSFTAMKPEFGFSGHQLIWNYRARTVKTRLKRRVFFLPLSEIESKPSSVVVSTFFITWPPQGPHPSVLYWIFLNLYAFDINYKFYMNKSTLSVIGLLRLILANKGSKGGLSVNIHLCDLLKQSYAAKM